jgi:hypothetical protein
MFGTEACAVLVSRDSLVIPEQVRCGRISTIVELNLSAELMIGSFASFFSSFN